MPGYFWSKRDIRMACSIFGLKKKNRLFFFCSATLIIQEAKNILVNFVEEDVLKDDIVQYLVR